MVVSSHTIKTKKEDTYIQFTIVGSHTIIDIGCSNIEIEPYYLIVNDLINSSKNSNVLLTPTVNECKYLIRRFEQYKFQHI